ncbi:hypothetical protein JQ633_21165 [Bradyrhizobium tropiciagri]|uniref:hypothetical protein n=1 Tax=Bradyrhizobium tropiciagri TaxID=312253 RepID=UPI001BA43D80|nr:hypothetical protein [Bradyrhizobium tropiciagri]MBR0872885.1 hypothetical protein [Bradyrhizobium tropiciagri]
MQTITTIGLVLAVLAATMPAAGARRGGHGSGHGGGHHMHGKHRSDTDGTGRSAMDRRSADNPYTDAASEKEDRLLNSKLKSICRGC